MSALANASPDAIDVVSLLAGLARRWRLLAVLSLGAGAVTFGACMLLRPTYTSEAQIAVLARGDANPYADPKALPAGETLAVRMDREAINTHAKALQAPELAQRIVADLRLAEHADFGSAVKDARPGASADELALAHLTRRLTVTAARDSRTILIRYAGHDRDLVAEIVNRLGEVYRESLAARSLSESDDVLKGLAPRIERLKQEVGEAEASVERFRGAANLFRSSQAGSLNEQQLGEMAAAETKARTEHAEAEARAKAARQLKESAEAQHPDVQKSPLLQKLLQDRARIEGDIAKATAMLKDGHPAMKQLRSELASTERQIKLEIRRVIEGLDKEVSVAALRLASVHKSLAELKARVVDTGTDQARLSQLEANTRAKRAELERLQAKYEANRARADSRVVPVEVQIVSRGRPAREPTFPKPLPYSGLAALAMLLLSASVTIARDLVVGARQVAPATRPQARAGTDTQRGAAAVVPAGSSPEPTTKTVAAAAERNQEAQVVSISDLANRLVSKRVERNGVRTLVAGVSGSADPSTEAVELVRTLAVACGPVMLVDWSLDGNGVARLLGLPVSPGLAELIDGRSGFIEAVGRVPGSAAQLIASGARLVSAAGRSDVHRINLLLDTLDEVYEQIVVVARFHAARDLFETIEGRFDFGVLVCGSGEVNGIESVAPGTFLGFDVDELEVLRLRRQPGGSGRKPVGLREHAA